MSDNKLPTISIEELRCAQTPISLVQEISCSELENGQTDQICLHFYGHQTRHSPQTPEGQHAFLVEHHSLVEQLKKILCLIDPLSAQQTRQDIRRIADRLDQKIE